MRHARSAAACFAPVLTMAESASASPQQAAVVDIDGVVRSAPERRWWREIFERRHTYAAKPPATGRTLFNFAIEDMSIFELLIETTSF
jgi:hypothetical protein